MGAWVASVFLPPQLNARLMLRQDGGGHGYDDDDGGDDFDEHDDGGVGGVLQGPYDDDTDDDDSDDNWQPPAEISDDESDAGYNDSSTVENASSSESSSDETLVQKRLMDRGNSDMDYVKVVLVFEPSFYAYGNEDDPLPDIDRGRMSADMVFTKEFAMLFGAAATVRLHPRMYPMTSIKNRFSIGLLANKAGYTVPEYCDAEEYIICCGAVEIAMSLKCTDNGTGTSVDAYRRDELTVIRFVLAMRKLGYPSAELNPSWASTHFVLLPGCLDKYQMRLCHVLVAIMAARPRVVSLVMGVGAEWVICMDDDVDGLFMGSMQSAYEYFWAWRDKMYDPDSEFVRHGGGRFYVVRCDMAVNMPRQNYPFMFENTRAGVNRRAIFGPEHRSDPEHHGYKTVTTEYSTFNGSRREGGVNKDFLKPMGLHSPSNITKVKCYPSSGHLVKMMHIIQDVNLSFRLGKIPVYKMKAYIFLMISMTHRLVNIIVDPELGIEPRCEITQASNFPRDDDNYQLSPERLALKTQGKVEWEEQFEKALCNYYDGDFNIRVMEQHECPTVQQLLEWAYYYAGCLLMELKKKNESPVQNCVPQNTGMYYMNYAFGMFVAACGLSGSSVHKATKKYLQSPPDVCYDPSGILSLIYKKEDVEKQDPEHDNFLRGLVRNNPLYDDGYTVMPGGVDVLLLLRRDQFATGMSPQDQATYEEYDEAYFEEGQQPDEMYRFLLPKLQEVFRIWSQMITNAFRAGAHDQPRFMRALLPHLKKHARLMARIPEEGRDLGQDAQERMVIWMPSMFSVFETDVREISHVVTNVPDAGVNEAMNSMDPPVNDPMHALYDEPPEYVEGFGAEQEDNPDPDPEIYDVELIRLQNSRSWCHHIVQQILQRGTKFANVRDAVRNKVRGVKVDEINNDDAEEPTGTELMSQEGRNLLLQMYEKIGNKSHARKAASECNVYVRDLVASPPYSAMDLWMRIIQCYNARYPNMFVLEEHNHMRLNIDRPLRHGGPGFGPSGEQTMADMEQLTTDDHIDRQSFFNDEAVNRAESIRIITVRRERNLAAVTEQRAMVERLRNIVNEGVDEGLQQLHEDQERIDGEGQSEEEELDN